MSVQLLQGDCLELMKDIPDGSVDMVLTDREKRRKDVMDRYYWYKSNGICSKCGHRSVELNKAMCSECLQKDAERKQKRQYTLTREQKDKLNQQHRDRKHRLISDGRCPTCGTKITDTRYKMCLECRLKARRWKKEHIPRKRWMECGLCRHCGSDEVVDGKTLCRECLDKQRAVAMENLSLANPDNSRWKRLNHAMWEELCQGH